MTTGAQATAMRARRLAAGPEFAAPLPPPPEQVAGIAAEVTFLRSRNFVVTTAGPACPGFWKLDGRIVSTAALLDKAASVRARSLRTAPPPVVPTGQAPITIVTTVRETRVQATPTDRFRGLGANGVREALQALRAPAGGPAKLARLLAVPEGSVSAVLCGAARPTPAMVDALYGPAGSDLLPKWLHLISRPAPAAPAPAVSPPPSGPTPPLDTAPAAEAAPAPAAAAPEAGAGMVAPASTPVAPAPDLPADIRPWSRLEDADLVAILRGKAAGLRAELVACDARRQAALADIAAIQAQALEAEARLTALDQTIRIFEGGADGDDGGADAAPGNRGQGEAA